VLLTGHTGFKGAWLSLWLQALGARVTGLAPGPPTTPSLYELARVGSEMEERAIDVRDAEGVRDVVRAERPEVVLHLAAQPLVRRSLRDPATTYAVNVIGTVNVLEAVRQAGDEVRAMVVVTSDKCYENPLSGTPPAPRRFVEDDPLGGDDPYSSSKACAELVTAAYRRSFFSAADDLAPPGRAGAQTRTRIASARAGNVIGGGDWGEDRLIGDIVRAVQVGASVKLRNPDAVRPWQHVLNPLSGYLRLAEELWHSPAAAEAWNFGPRAGDARTVRWIVERLEALWAGAFEWELDARANPPEAGHLALDSGKAERRLGWRAEWDLGQALERVVEWHEAARRGEDMRRVSLAQIERFGRASGGEAPGVGVSGGNAPVREGALSREVSSEDAPGRGDGGSNAKDVSK
jgi:CDP-glucose 4,6-dehydratase